MSLNAEAAALLREALREADLTQRALAGRLGISDVQVSRVLAGSQNVSLGRLEAYADALGVTLRIETGQPRLQVGHITGEELYWSYVEQSLLVDGTPCRAWDGLSDHDRKTWDRLAATVLPRRLIEAVTS